MSEIDPNWLRKAFDASVAQLTADPDACFGDSALCGALTAALVAVADNLQDRSVAIEQAKRRGWKSSAAELQLAAHHVGAYADAMRAFDPDADVPQPDNSPDNSAPRCANFRRITTADPMLCHLERGHDGDHEGVHEGLGESWPRRHSGAVCGDVITNGPRVLNCELPLGHDGDMHWSDGGSWARGVDPRPVIAMSERPDVDYPGKPGDDGLTIVDDVPGGDQGVPTPEQEAALYPGACGNRLTKDVDPAPDSDTCMLPGGHTGIHIGRTGQRWAQAEIVVSIDPTPTGLDTVVVASVVPAPRQSTETKQESAVMTLDNPESLMCGARNGLLICGLGKRHDVEHMGMGPAGVVHWSLDDAPPVGVISLGSYAMPALEPVSNLTTIPLGIMTAPPATLRLGLVAPGEPRARQSVSSITTMEDCGLKYRFTYRDQLPQTPAWWNVGGTAVHETIREIEHDATLTSGSSRDFWATGDLHEQQKAASGMFGLRLDGEIEKEETTSGVSRQSWRAADKGKESLLWWRAAGDDMVRAYVAQRGAWLKDWRLVRTLTGGTAQELEFTHLFGTVDLKGFIDDLWVHRTDPTRVMVRDTKAGKRPPESNFQLEVYGEVIKALPTELAFAQGPLRVEGTYYLARKAETTFPVLLGGNAEIITYRAEQVAAADAAGIFMPRPSSFCGSCPFASKCPAVK